MIQQISKHEAIPINTLYVIQVGVYMKDFLINYQSMEQVQPTCCRIHADFCKDFLRNYLFMEQVLATFYRLQAEIYEKKFIKNCLWNKFPQHVADSLCFEISLKSPLCGSSLILITLFVLSVVTQFDCNM